MASFGCLLAQQILRKVRRRAFCCTCPFKAPLELCRNRGRGGERLMVDVGQIKYEGGTPFYIFLQKPRYISWAFFIRVCQQWNCLPRVVLVSLSKSGSKHIRNLFFFQASIYPGKPDSLPQTKKLRKAKLFLFISTPKGNESEPLLRIISKIITNEGL